MLREWAGVSTTQEGRDILPVLPDGTGEENVAGLAEQMLAEEVAFRHQIVDRFSLEQVAAAAALLPPHLLGRCASALVKGQGSRGLVAAAILLQRAAAGNTHKNATKAALEVFNGAVWKAQWAAAVGAINADVEKHLVGAVGNVTMLLAGPFGGAANSSLRASIVTLVAAYRELTTVEQQWVAEFCRISNVPTVKVTPDVLGTVDASQIPQVIEWVSALRLRGQTDLARTLLHRLPQGTPVGSLSHWHHLVREVVACGANLNDVLSVPFALHGDQLQPAVAEDVPASTWRPQSTLLAPASIPVESGPFDAALLLLGAPGEASATSASAVMSCCAAAGVAPSDEALIAVVRTHHQVPGLLLAAPGWRSGDRGRVLRLLDALEEAVADVEIVMPPTRLWLYPTLTPEIMLSRPPSAVLGRWLLTSGEIPMSDFLRGKFAGLGFEPNSDVLRELPAKCASDDLFAAVLAYPQLAGDLFTHVASVSAVTSALYLNKSAMNLVAAQKLREWLLQRLGSNPHAWDQLQVLLDRRGYEDPKLGASVAAIAGD